MNNNSTPDDYYTLRKPNWQNWGSVSKAKLWHAAALATDVDPANFRYFDLEKIRPNGLALNYPADFVSLLTLAKNSLGPGGLLKPESINMGSLEDTEISLSRFATWLKAVGHRPPDEFPWLPEGMAHSNLDWPWGRHETELLRHLAGATDLFWKRFDPNDPTTAPKNAQVIKWLEQQGVTSNIARAMATILRADGLPTRTKK